MTSSAMLQLIKGKKWAEIQSQLVALHSTEAAELLMELDPPIRVVIFRALPRKFAAKIFTNLDSQEKDDLLVDLTDHETNKLLADLTPDDRTDLFEEMPAEVTQKLLQLLSPEDLKEARELLGYPVDSVGREMTPDYISITAGVSVKKTLEYIRRHGKDKETINVVYVVDKDGKLLDEVKLKYLIFAKEDAKVEEVSRGAGVTALSAFDDQEKAIELIKKLNAVALPVVDSEGVLIGIVTIDDLIDIHDEEVTEDFHKMGAVSVEHGGDISLTNFADASINLLYRKRIMWLILLVGVNIVSGAILASFETIIIEAVALIFFLPLLIASGGNAGAQAATLMVRALGTGDVKMSDWMRMIGRETLIAGLLGATMAFAVSILGIFRGGVEVAVVVSLAMFAIVLVGSVIGVSLPFIFTKLKRDPATASGPLVTSVADICGILIYFSIAQWYLGL